MNTIWWLRCMVIENQREIEISWSICHFSLESYRRMLTRLGLVFPIRQTTVASLSKMQNPTLAVTAGICCFFDRFARINDDEQLRYICVNEEGRIFLLRNWIFEEWRVKNRFFGNIDKKYVFLELDDEIVPI